MKTLNSKLLILLFLLCSFGSKAQFPLEDFSSYVLPPGWTLINDGRTVDSYIGDATYLTSNAWMVSNDLGWPGDALLYTTSYFSPESFADRWAITPAFLVNNPNQFLIWDEVQLLYVFPSFPVYSDSIEIYVGAATASTKSDFTTVLYKGKVNRKLDFANKRGVNLSAYYGQNVRIAFRSVGLNGGVFGIDNIQSTNISPKTDIQLASCTPVSGSTDCYGPIGRTIKVGGTLNNLGTTTVSLYTIKYQLGSGPIQSENKFNTLYPFSSSIPFEFTTNPIFNSTSAVPLKVWIQVAGDTVKSNDTLIVNVSAYTLKPSKKFFVEERTGMWCSWCVRGIIYSDSLVSLYPSNCNLVAVHNDDSLAVPNYDSFYLNGLDIGYPSSFLDRNSLALNPAFLSDCSRTKDSFGVAQLNLSMSLSGDKLSVTSQVKPFVNIQADYRLALILSEDSVFNPLYKQRNAYSGGFSGPMNNKHFDFVALPDPVPGNKMYYDFTARGIYPAPQGAIGSLPYSMNSGTTYSYTFSPITLDAKWRRNKLKATVILINNTDGSVLNSEGIYFNSLGITNVEPKRPLNCTLYPNPAHNEFNLLIPDDFTNEKAVIKVMDLFGKELMSYSDFHHGLMTIPTNQLNSGFFLVKIIIGDAIEIKQLSIVK